MARTLAAQPKILLMDEPFASLDEQTRLLLGDKVLQSAAAQADDAADHPQHHRGGAALRPHPGDDLSSRQGEAMVEIKLPRPRSSEIVSSEAFGRYVAQNLERPAGGGDPRARRRGGAQAARGREAMTPRRW